MSTQDIKSWKMDNKGENRGRAKGMNKTSYDLMQMQEVLDKNHLLSSR